MLCFFLALLLLLVLVAAALTPAQSHFIGQGFTLELLLSLVDLLCCLVDHPLVLGSAPVWASAVCVVWCTTDPTKHPASLAALCFSTFLSFVVLFDVFLFVLKTIPLLFL